jgi:hypothetical protein
MSTNLREQIYNRFNTMTTEELNEIWKRNDRVEWSDLAFEVLGDILKKRTNKLPEQNEPIHEYTTNKEITDKDDGLKDWEIKLLDDENQPELYDTLEVLSLRDNVDKLIKATVFIYILLAVLNSYTISALFSGQVPSLRDIPDIFWDVFITSITVGIKIALIYFPLKALNQILRILMEMEFNSRKAKS